MWSLAIFLLYHVVTIECFVVSRPKLGIIKANEADNILSLHKMTPATMVTDVLEQATSFWMTAVDTTMVTPPESAGISYSKASYYTVLGLYLMSFPGLWSIVKRSTAAKVKRKTYVTPGENAKENDAKGLRQQAGEIMACKYFSRATKRKLVFSGENNSSFLIDLGLAKYV
jgi:Cofactor assembly of complex C subunit B